MKIIGPLQLRYPPQANSAQVVSIQPALPRRAALHVLALTSLILMLAGLILLQAPISFADCMLLGGLAAGLFAMHFSLLPAPPAVTNTNGTDTAAHEMERLQDAHWQLSENEARYRDLLDTQQEMIVRRNSERQLVFVNKSFCRVFGLAASSVLGQTFEPVIVDGGKPPALTKGNGNSLTYATLTETDHGRRWIAWEDQVVATATGLEVQSTGRDVTQEREAEALLKEARDQAESANRAKSRFLAAMSHEIRTPMNGILGMVSLLSDTAQNAEQQTYTNAVDQSARALLALIDEILDFSKIEAGKLELVAETFSLQSCVQRAIELLSPRAAEKALDLVWSFEPDVPRFVVGDEARVRQIVLNLVSNAVKFTDRGGVRISVKAQEEPAKKAVVVSVHVEDTGIGLSNEDMKTLFREFEQADAAVARRQGGTGLGLAISKRLARAMGGDIAASGIPGKGATFIAHFRLGITSEEAADARGSNLLNGVKALLAFNRTFERNQMATQLERSGALVVQCDFLDSKEAIRCSRAASKEFTHLVVDGDEDPLSCGNLLEFMRAAQTSGPVAGMVLFTILARTGSSAHKDNGFQTSLMRPVRPELLLQRFSAQDRPKAAPETELSHEDKFGNSQSRARVLIAEDNDINALLARRVIEKAGCDPVMVSNGNEAVAAIRSSMQGGQPAFDLVLMDVFMPGLDGLDATRAIRDLYREAGLDPASGPPIIALTANAFAEDRERCLASGMNDYLAKPFDAEHLGALLRRWVPNCQSIDRAKRSSPAA